MNRLLPAVIIAVFAWTFYASGQGTNSPGSRVTVQNPISNPAIVTCTNCGSINLSSALNVTVTNTPTVTLGNNTASVSCISGCSGGSIAGAINVTVTNTPTVTMGNVNIASILNNPTVTIGNTTINSKIVNTPSVTFSNVIASIANTPTVTLGNNTASVTCISGCGASSVTGPFNVTVTNVNSNGQATMANSSPVVIASDQAGLSVTVSNTASNPATVSCTNCASTVSLGSAINVTVTNIPTVTIGNNTASVSCISGCSASSVTGPFNVTVTNTPTVTMSNVNVAAILSTTTVTHSNVNIASILNVPTVTIGNTTINAKIVNTPNVTFTNIIASIANTPNVTFSNVNASILTSVLTTANVVGGPTTGGASMLTTSNLLTTSSTIKSSAGQLMKLYCYNPNATVAYVQTFNTTSVTAGTTKPVQFYGIPATSSAGFVMNPIGDQYSTAISVVATTTATGGTPPSTGIDCSFSFN